MIAIEHPARTLDEYQQKVEFAWTQFDHLAGRGDQAPATGVEQPAIEAKPVAGSIALNHRRSRHLGLATGAAQDGANPRDQFTRIEWLGDVVVTAHFQTDHTLGAVITGGQKDYRCRIGQPEPTAQTEAILARQHEIEHDQIHRLPGQAGAHRLAIGRNQGPKTMFGQVAGQQ